MGSSPFFSIVPKGPYILCICERCDRQAIQCPPDELPKGWVRDVDFRLLCPRCAAFETKALPLGLRHPGPRWWA